MDVKDAVSGILAETGGLLRLKPAWVSRVFLPPGKRLGLPDEAYDAGERGYLTERWLGSTTEAENPIHTPDEGLSFIDAPDGARITLKDAVEALPGEIMGDDYSALHKGLGRLPKIFDNAGRLPFHIHQRQEDAEKLGKKSKEESYYFPPGLPMGPHPETFFGLHPFIVRENRRDILVKYLEDWEHTDRLLSLSRAYINMPDDGFHLPPGILHAPGSALTIELQEDSDVCSMFQGRLDHTLLDRAALTRDVPPEELEKNGLMAAVEQLDWEANGDPYFYENHHTPPVRIEGARSAGSEEWWIFYNTRKYSGAKLILSPGASRHCVDRGAYNILVWSGEGAFGGLPIKGQSHTQDEIMVTAGRARSGIEIVNTGPEYLMIIKFFGPDINDDAPMLKRYR
ncbi:MAG: hypothetical protein LBS53_15175 [Synergistaceae bacterium]|nr:hypothetical protein [Synergistaceae bacterium]